MKILITGAGGFIGKNLTARLNELIEDVIIYYYDIETPEEKKVFDINRIDNILIISKIKLE